MTAVSANVQQLLAESVVFPESPRWHQDRLWFSDVYDFALKSVDLAGRSRVIAAVPGRPAGLGALPDGRMLMATAVERVRVGIVLLSKRTRSVTRSIVGALARLEGEARHRAVTRLTRGRERIRAHA